MTVHWQSLDTSGKIEAIRAFYKPGMSSTQIAARFEGATRNAVIGLFHRHPDWMTGLALRNPQNYPGKERTAPTNGRPRNKRRKKLPDAALYATESHLCGRALSMLASKECRWPVNDAQVGELHLFCGRPASGNYCNHHLTRLYQPEAPRGALHGRTLREAR